MEAQIKRAIEEHPIVSGNENAFYFIEDMVTYRLITNPDITYTTYVPATLDIENIVFSLNCY